MWRPGRRCRRYTSRLAWSQFTESISNRKYPVMWRVIIFVVCRQGSRGSLSGFYHALVAFVKAEIPPQNSTDCMLYTRHFDVCRRDLAFGSLGARSRREERVMFWLAVSGYGTDFIVCLLSVDCLLIGCWLSIVCNALRPPVRVMRKRHNSSCYERL